LERSRRGGERKSSIKNQAGAEKEKVMVAIMQRHQQRRKNRKSRKRINESRTDQKRKFEEVNRKSNQSIPWSIACDLASPAEDWRSALPFPPKTSRQSALPNGISIFELGSSRLIEKPPGWLSHCLWSPLILNVLAAIHERFSSICWRKFLTQREAISLRSKEIVGYIMRHWWYSAHLTIVSKLLTLIRFETRLERPDWRNRARDIIRNSCFISIDEMARRNSPSSIFGNRLNTFVMCYDLIFELCISFREVFESLGWLWIGENWKEPSRNSNARLRNVDFAAGSQIKMDF